MTQVRDAYHHGDLRNALVASQTKLGAVLVLLCMALLTGCRTVRPPIEHWRGCLVSGASLGPVDITKLPNPQSWTPRHFVVEHAGNTVLLLEEDWGRHPFASEHQHGELWLQLPEPVTEGYRWNFGPTHPVDGRFTGELATRFEYREGGDVLMFGSDKVTGSILVTAANEASVTATLDLVASDPYVDQMKRESVVIRGSVTALRVRQASECPR